MGARMFVVRVNDDDFGKSLAHKYIKRVPKPTGKGYYYVYPKDLKTSLKTLLSVFGNQKNAIQEDYGATKQIFASQMLQYLINKVKWDTYFSKKENKETAKTPVKQKNINSNKKFGDDGQKELFEKKPLLFTAECIFSTKIHSNWKKSFKVID